jgi:hypothetical protein
MIGRAELALLCLIFTAGPAAAQESGSQPPAGQAQPPAGQTPPVDANSPEGQSVEPEVLPPSAYAEGERPAAREKVYDAKEAKVWAAIVDVLKKTDVPVASADEAAGVLKSELLEFEFKRFFDVATRPPAMTRERPIYQAIHLNQGWFSIEVHLAKAKKGTNVSIRAHIEEAARDLVHMKRVRAERYSNGKIEDSFFAKIDEALK